MSQRKESVSLIFFFHFYLFIYLFFLASLLFRKNKEHPPPYVTKGEIYFRDPQKDLNYMNGNFGNLEASFFRLTKKMTAEAAPNKRCGFGAGGDHAPPPYQWDLPNYVNRDEIGK